jgi:hypothetical protein
LPAGVTFFQKKGGEKKRKYLIHNVSRARLEEGEFHTTFGRVKDDRQKFFKYFKTSFSKFENLKQVLKRRIHDGDEA